MASAKGKASTKANNKKNTSRTASAGKKAAGTKAAASKTAKRTSVKSSTGRTARTEKSPNTTGAAPRQRTFNEKNGVEYERFMAKERMFRNEIAILVSAAVSLFLFCSNLHLCGTIGEFFHNIMCGSMGIMGYAFPVYVTVVVSLVLLIRGSFKPQFKMIAAFIVYWALCGAVELFFGGNFDKSLALMDYYEKGLEQTGGGILGGMITMLLVPNISFAGTLILMIVIILIGVVYISEHSIVEPIGQKSKKVYHNAKEDLDRHRIERKRYLEEVRNTERRNYYQPDLNSDNNMTADDEYKTDTESCYGQDLGKNRSKILASDTNRNRSGRGIKESRGADGIAVKKQAGSRKEESGTPFIDIANRGKMRNLNEFVVSVGEEEKPKGKPVNAPEDWYREEPEVSVKHEYVPHKKDEIDNIDVIFDEDFTFRNITEDEDNSASAAVTAEDEDVLDLNGCKEDVYADIFTDDTGRSLDTRRVVTATGKIIEKDIDPTEDPIGAKSRRTSIDSNESDINSGFSADNNVRPARKSAAGRSGSGNGISAEEFKTLNAQKPVRKSRPYVKPPIRLLARQTRAASAMTADVLNNTAMKLQQTLRDFGVGVTVTDYSCGPAVTRYELQPDHGVKVSKIVALADDIKLNLAAEDIRIEAPIPGKSVVGIEVPNKENSTVYFRNVIESDDFCNHPSKLAFAVGKDIGGNNIVADLSRMPHLLIAGATGSGKSVCINTLIMSILYKSTPEEVQLLMIDPKVVELSVYNGIPHLKYPVVTDPKMASGTLNWAVSEMTDRYKKFAEYNVRDIKGYNEKVERLIEEGEEVSKLPQIVIIVDELADLMMVAPGEVEDAICRLAQMARAAGLHLVIATQRPSVNVITGLIKANIPSRIAFAVSSGVDSRTIIDMNGAEKLLGKGDMLFYPSGYAKPIRVQGAFISDSEVSKVVEFLSGNSEPVYDDNIKEAISKFSSGAAKNAQPGTSGDNRYDEYFERAGRFIIEKDKASIGMLQRVLKIGFNRAGRIMDQLAEAGVVGEEEGTKPRKVLMSMEQFESFIEECL